MEGYMEDARKMLETRIENYKIEISVLEAIKPIIEKWDKKVLNKRLADALTKECSNLPWDVKFYIYKEFHTRGFYFIYHDSRCFCQKCYVTEVGTVLTTVDHNTMKERINASAGIRKVNALIDWTTSQTDKLQDELNSMNDLIARHNQLLQAYREFRNSLSGDFIDIMEKNYLFNRM